MLFGGGFEGGLKAALRIDSGGLVAVPGHPVQQSAFPSALVCRWGLVCITSGDCTGNLIKCIFEVGLSLRAPGSPFTTCVNGAPHGVVLRAPQSGPVTYFF